MVVLSLIFSGSVLVATGLLLAPRFIHARRLRSGARHEFASQLALVLASVESVLEDPQLMEQARVRVRRMRKQRGSGGGIEDASR